MLSVPTDLLRAFVTIIDLKGYTRAGERLGRTQPAISLQMKKLQDLVGTPLFDKESGANKLTEAGEMVAGYARQILALNDDMMLRLAKRDTRGKLRLGITNDYADHLLPRLLAGLTAEGAGVTFDVTCELSAELLRGLRDGRYDMVVAMTSDGPAEGAFMTWRESLTWAGGDGVAVPFAATDPVRLVCYSEGCLYRRAMLSALQRGGRAFDVVYATPSQSGIEAAVTAGFGVTAIADRVLPPSLRALGPEAGLPRLADVVVGIYLNETGSRSMVAQSLAARFADMFASRVETGAAA